MNLPVRLRRLRDNAATRRLFQETTVGIGNLLQPYFVVPEKDVKREAKAGTALYQASGAPLYEEAAVLARAGCGGLMLFGVPPYKRDTPDQLAEQLVPLTEAARTLKKVAPSLPLFADVCLCSYTTHGHCGLVKDGVVLNLSLIHI